MNLSVYGARSLIKILLALTVLLISGCSEDERPKNFPVSTKPISIIPQPLLIERLPGEFIFSTETKIIATDDAGKRLAAVLNQAFVETCGIKIDTTDEPETPNAITFATLPSQAILNPEEYLLRIEWDKIQLIGSERGMFYGVQSLLKLLPLQCNGVVTIPAAEIFDSPRFSYRGMQLDVARHFMPVEFVKKYIRLLSQYKFNYFHWHLTDDQGWRIEIKKYPRLTEIGSTRPETVLGKNYQPYRGDGRTVEGFYTQDEIREIVAYAKARHVTVIPEIDMPGHSSAALAAYPQYGCRPNFKYKVKTTWGGFPDILCPTEETFQFVTDVLGEVIELFPESPYIHIGGDEVIPDQWKESQFVKSLKKTENLNSELDVQSWFLQRIETYVNSGGKTIIGWDEILDGKPPPAATVMSWRGLDGGIKAAMSGRYTIMTPDSFVYFDRPQSDSSFEPLALGKPLSLREVYSFEPVPNAINYDNRKFVIGAQGCVWTEFIKKPADVEYMAFPRAIALSEVLWSPKSSKNFGDFQTRLAGELSRLDKQRVNYRIPEPLGLFDQELRAGRNAMIELRPSVTDGAIFYTLDGAIPTDLSSEFRGRMKLNIPEGRTLNLRARIVTPSGRRSQVFDARYSVGAVSKTLNNRPGGK